MPKQCQQCEYLFACHGECPKNRIIKTEQGEDGLNYLCRGWMDFFTHIDPILNQLLQANGYPLRKAVSQV